MADSRVSVLILAKDEAENLPECLASARWADEVIVVVDRASRDDTQAIASRGADRVAVRTFDDFASQRNAALELASGEWATAVLCRSGALARAGSNGNRISSQRATSPLGAPSGER